MNVVFVDEAGSPSPADGRRFLVVVALVADSSRAIELHVKRTRRTLRLRAPRSELKAAHSRSAVIGRLLRALAQESCNVYAVVVDKQGVPEESTEEVYRAAIGQVVLHVVRDHPDLHLYLDKRYTNHRQRLDLERAIRQTIAAVPGQVLVIEQVDSTAYPGLQAADFIAWAVAQKHERGETWAVEIIAQRVMVEEIVQGKKLAAPPGGR